MHAWQEGPGDWFQVWQDLQSVMGVNVLVTERILETISGAFSSVDVRDLLLLSAVGATYVPSPVISILRE